jgi:hypothetical protein
MRYPRKLTFKRYCDCLSVEATFQLDRDLDDDTDYYTLWDKTVFGKTDTGSPSEGNEELDIYKEYRKDTMTIEDIRKYAFRAYLMYMEITVYLNYNRCYAY